MSKEYNEISAVRDSIRQLDILTKEHSMRLMELSEEIIPLIHLSCQDSEILSLSAALHDIGKRNIPLTILNNEGSLSREDYEIIKKHPFLGWQMLKEIDDLKPVAEAILYHHERWDGKGYPTRCSKERIPILSRIISVLDAFDAMTNDRHYRRAMPVQYACDEISRNAGTQFDPEISKIFIRMCKEKYLLQ